jgi:hypothetical protein
MSLDFIRINKPAVRDMLIKMGIENDEFWQFELTMERPVWKIH